MHGTTQNDGSITIHSDTGVLVAEVHTDGTATVINDDQPVTICAADLPQEPEKSETKESELSLEEWLSSFEDKSSSESSTWNQQAQTQNCSKSFADSSASYTAKPQEQVPPSSAPIREETKSSQSDARDRSRAALIAGAGLQAAGGADVDLLAVAPEVVLAGVLPGATVIASAASAVAAGVSELVRGPSNDGSSLSSTVTASIHASGHDAEAHEARPGVAELAAVLSRVARFAEKIFHRQDDTAMQSTPLQDALALHAAHRLSLKGDVTVGERMVASWSNAIDWRRALSEPALAWSTFVGQAMHSPAKAAGGVGNASSLGAILHAMVSDLGVDPLAIAYATSAAGIFQMPPLNFVGQALASQQSQFSQAQLLDRVDPPHASSRGHGREEGESNQGGQQERHQQDQYPSDEYPTEHV